MGRGSHCVFPPPPNSTGSHPRLHGDLQRWRCDSSGLRVDLQHGKTVTPSPATRYYTPFLPPLFTPPPSPPSPPPSPPSPLPYHHRHHRHHHHHYHITTTTITAAATAPPLTTGRLAVPLVAVCVPHVSFGGGGGDGGHRCTADLPPPDSQQWQPRPRQGARID